MRDYKPFKLIKIIKVKRKENKVIYNYICILLLNFILKFFLLVEFIFNYYLVPGHSKAAELSEKGSTAI